MPPLPVRTATQPANAIDADAAWVPMLRTSAEDDDLIGYEAALPFLRHDAAGDMEPTLA